MRSRGVRATFMVIAATAVSVAYGWPDEAPDPATAPYAALAGPQPALPPDSRHLYSFASAGATLTSESYPGIWEADRFASPFPASHSVPIPDFAPVLRAQREFLEGLSDQAKPATARAALDRDLAFWRGALEGANVVAIKRAAVRAVEHNLRTRARLAQAHHEAGVLASAPRLQRLSIRERSFFEPLAFELAIDRDFIAHLDDFLNSPGQRRWDVAVLPYRLERTYNRHIAHNAPVLAMACLDAAELVDAYARRPRRLHTLGPWDYVVNAKGVWALEMADASHLYGAYMLSGHDLDALVVLVNLVEDMARAGVASASAQDFITRDPDKYRNPFVPRELTTVSPDGRRAYFASQPGEGGKARLRLELELR